MKAIYIEHNGKRYRLGRNKVPRFCDCTRRCLFRRRDGKSGQFLNDNAEYCCNGCYLPKWFKDLAIPESWLEKIIPFHAKKSTKNVMRRNAK